MEVQKITTFTIKLMVRILLQVAFVRRRQNHHKINTKSMLKKNNNQTNKKSVSLPSPNVFRLSLGPELEIVFPWMRMILDLGFIRQLIRIVAVVAVSSLVAVL